MTRDEKRKYWEGKWEKVEKSKNLTENWEAIKPFKPKRADMGKQIDKGEWIEHFKQLLEGNEGIDGRDWQQEADNGQTDEMEGEIEEKVNNQISIRGLKRMGSKKNISNPQGGGHREGEQ